ncbi:tetratricopeptide repeat protein [Terricaulis sp.]|uniref:tetratricopeptide repeat protein n=1 Tax=Terricaulis sp. TaxID=2768686 RepID=UPI003782DB00
MLTAIVTVWGLAVYRRAEGAGEAQPLPALAACALIVLTAVGVYAAVGHPELPGASYRERLEALRHRNPATYTFDEALAVLAEAAKSDPRDPLPYLYSGDLLLRSERPQEAARAYDAALRRDPELAEAMLGLGKAMVAAEGGTVSPQALELFRQAGARMNDPAPWIYLALEAMQHDRGAEARRYWAEAYARMGPDDPRRAMAQRFSRELGR